MKLGFIKPNYPGEKRVALLPHDINDCFENQLFIEKGFGDTMNISDDAYAQKGASILSRSGIFEECDAIFSLKLIQPDDYSKLREKQLIIGWTHPTGSGYAFYNQVAVSKKLLVADLDNIYPTLYYEDKKTGISWLNRNFVYKNSFNAGYSATVHAMLSHGKMLDSNMNVAILSPGNVSQGALFVVSRLGGTPRLFYRKTMNDFYDSIYEYDVIINGIEVDGDEHIIDKEMLSKCKKGCLIIDAAADAGNAIEGTRYTTIDDPIYEEDGLFFYEVNNAPSIFFRNASQDISAAFSKSIYCYDTCHFLELGKSIGYQK